MLGAGAGAYYVTSSMSCNEFNLLIDHGNYPKLQDYLDSEFGETSSFASITQKRTSACTSGHVSGAADGTPGDPEDVILQIRGSRRTCNGGEPQWREPESGNGAAAALARRHHRRLRQPLVDRPGRGRRVRHRTPCRRRTSIRSTGNRFVPGFDPAHLGGDNWSANAAISEINNDPELARHDGQPRRHRQDGPHVGAGGPR